MYKTYTFNTITFKIFQPKECSRLFKKLERNDMMHGSCLEYILSMPQNPHIRVGTEIPLTNRGSPRRSDQKTININDYL